MCCLYMDSSEQQGGGGLIVGGSGSGSSSSSYGGLDPIAVERFLCTDSSQSSPMIDLTNVGSNVDELHYLIHEDLPRSMFDQLEVFQQQENFSLLPDSVAGHIECLDDLIHAASHQIPSGSFAVTNTSSSASASAASSSSSDRQLLAHESGATSILHTEQQHQQQQWVCDPTSFCFASDNNRGVFVDSSTSSKQQSAIAQDHQHHQALADSNVGNMHATMRETLYKMAVWRPVNHVTTDCLGAAGTKPKRRNVRISSDPQTVAARHRRERISTKIRILQRLVPGGTKMDTASMLDEAIHYVKYLKSQVQAMELLEQSSESLLRSSTAAAATTASAATSAAAAAAAAATAAAASTAGGLCHLYNPQSGLLNGSIFWPQQFSMDNSSGLLVQQVNIPGY